MAKKLGYTFYPKDWRADLKVTGLSLEEKGFYRELIDECFLNMSDVLEINYKSFCRVYGINVRTFRKLSGNLSETSLIVLENFCETSGKVKILVPSVSGRIALIKGAIKGGKASVKNDEKNATKYKHKQKEKVKIKIIEKKVNQKSIQERKSEFKNSLSQFLDKYDKDLLNAFYGYWTEHNENGKKMRFEYAKNQPFNIGRRLGTWKAGQKKKKRDERLFPKNIKVKTRGLE